MTKNIMIVGVGGQGTLLASRIIGSLLIEEGFDVKVSEVHGMSQRGGSVVTYVKYGEKVFSPIIGKGEADVILAFELLEAYRALPYLKKGGKLIVNRQSIAPMPVITGAAQYPEDIEKKLSAKADILACDALLSAERAGSFKAVNVVLIGALAASTEIKKDSWLEAVKKNVPAKLLEVNLKAFEEGWRIGKDVQA